MRRQGGAPCAPFAFSKAEFTLSPSGNRPNTARDTSSLFTISKPRCFMIDTRPIMCDI